MSLLDINERLDGQITEQFLSDSGWELDDMLYYKYVRVQDSKFRSGQRTIGTLIFDLNHKRGKYININPTVYKKIGKDPICEWNDICSGEDILLFEVKVNDMAQKAYKK